MDSILKYDAKIAAMFGQVGSVFGIAAMQLHDHYQFKILTSDMAVGAGLTKYRSTYPEDFVDVGIAEQNLIGMAAGLASEGHKVIAVAQACFISMRSFEQIRQYLGYMSENVILVGINSGFSLTYFGNTHYALEDIALMRLIPGLTILSPADSGEAMCALETALNLNTPTYIRLSGTPNCPIVYPDPLRYDQLKSNIVFDNGTEICVCATGSMVAQCQSAAKLLEEKGIHCRVIDCYCLKPLDESLDNIIRESKLVCTVEEHRIIGGLGTIIAEYMSENDNMPRLLRIGVGEIYPKVGDYPYLLEQNGLTPEKISKTIIEAL